MDITREWYRVLFELASDYAYVLCVSSDGHVSIEWANQAFECLIAGAAGGPFPWASLVYPGDRALFQRHVERLLAGERSEAEYRVVRCDGSIHWLRDSARPVWDEWGGTVVWIAGVAQDISGQRRAEAERAAALASLSEREAALAHAEEVLSASRKQVHTVSRHLVEALENERRTIARDLHDEAGQSLTALRIGLGLLRDDLAFPQQLAPRIDELRRITGDVMEELHRLSANLRPANLDRAGLVPALAQHISDLRLHTGLQVEFGAVGLEDGRLPSEVETALYRVIQEALTNVARHAGARHVEVLLERRHERAVAIDRG